MATATIGFIVTVAIVVDQGSIPVVDRMLTLILAGHPTRQLYVPKDYEMWCDTIRLLEKCGKDVSIN